MQSGLPTAYQMGAAKVAMATAESDNKMRNYLALVMKDAGEVLEEEYTDRIWQALESTEKSHGPILMAPDARDKDAVNAYEAFTAEWEVRVEKAIKIKIACPRPFARHPYFVCFLFRQAVY